MKISYKSVVAAVALAMGGTANADIIDTGTNAQGVGGFDSNLMVSVYNITDGFSTVLNTGLTLADFRNNTGGPTTPKTTPNQSWSMDLSGLSINAGDQVVWMAGAGHLVSDFNYGFFSTLDNNLPGSTISLDRGNLGLSLQKFDGYANSIDAASPNYTVVTGSNGTAGEQSRIFDPNDGAAFAGIGWLNNWGNAFLWDATNGLDQSSGLYYASVADTSGNFVTYDPLMTATLAADGTFGIAAVSAVPVPAAAWLFGSGLVGLVGVSRRRKQ